MKLRTITKIGNGKIEHIIILTGVMTNMRITKCCLIMFFLFLLSGCWDKKELNEVAVVMGVGIDKVDKEYKITAQVIKPPTGEQAGGGGSELPTWSVSATGRTVLGAIRNLNELSPRRLYFAHLQVIIFGDELAREGIAPAIAWFERDRDSRAGALLVVTKGTAEDLLNQKIELGNVSSKSMSELIERSTIRQISAMEIKLRDLMTILSTPGIEPVLDVINPKEIRGKVETFELDGVAIFNKDKLKGYVYGSDATGTEIINSKLNFSIIEGKCPKQEEEYFAFQITDFLSKVKPELKGERITLKVNVTLEGNLLDQTCPLDLLKTEYLHAVEKEIAMNIKNSVENEFQVAKNLGSDIYGVGREVRRFYPEYWKEIRGSSDYLNRVDFDIKVKSNLRRSGLIIDPTEVKVKEETD
ncbi:Ger(x)C family spore germination protein [Robertmurraya yapensis]|uniref:Ger(X)C family spore germination protein n=2 Tax=Bacillus yapensis TaxID=2492960 RepID=A0A3S0JR02_9BACI|nr:Ger(x)C family spore germination protein [Bacillus yapensis]TKS93978.1 Ger(x)C family spore germination protein [Bacillus yapensis]